MGTVPILLSINDSIGNRHPRLNRIKTRERERSLEGIYECLRERMPRNGEWKERIFVNSCTIFNFFHYFFPILSIKEKLKKSYLVVERNESIFSSPESNPLLMEKLGGQATLGKVGAEIFSHASLIVHRLKVRGELATPLHMRVPFRDVLHVRQHTRCRDVTD